MSGDTVLELRAVTKAFGATIALREINLKLEAGRFHALLGENGAGKSTLLNILSGSLKPGAGSILFRGAPYSPADPLEARRLGIAHMHQELSLCGHLSVAENIFMGAEPHRAGWMNRRAMNQQAAEILESFPHPALTPQRRVSDLTIAARQIVEVCRALARRASLILMDEPTSSLQRADVERLFQFIRRLSGSGVSVIYVSHFLEEVREIADTFTVLRDGRSVLRGGIAQVSDDRLVSAMVGRPVREIFPACGGASASSAAPLGASEIALRVEDLSAPPAVVRAGFAIRA